MGMASMILIAMENVLCSPQQGPVKHLGKASSSSAKGKLFWFLDKPLSVELVAPIPPLITLLGGVLPEPCAHRARTVRPFAYSVSGRSTLPESELPWLVAGLPVYYHRSNGDRVSATVVDPSSRGGRRVSIRYELGGEEVLYEHAPEERLEFAIVTAESPDSPQPVHHEAPMDALLEPQLPKVEAEAPRIDDHEPECCGG